MDAFPGARIETVHAAGVDAYGLPSAPDVPDMPDFAPPDAVLADGGEAGGEYFNDDLPEESDE